MRNFASSFPLLLFLLFACGGTSNSPGKVSNNSIELYNSFDKENHLQPVFDKLRFDTLHGWDLGWALLQPINKAPDQAEGEISFSRRLSPGQKALYFYWYLNDEVTNGGFIQFYWNGYRKYLPPIRDGLKLVGDTSMVKLVEEADKEFLSNKEKFDLQREKDDWGPLYEHLKKFDDFDSIFYRIQNKPMELLEVYMRKHPEEFVKLR